MQNGVPDWILEQKEGELRTQGPWVKPTGRSTALSDTNLLSVAVLSQLGEGHKGAPCYLCNFFKSEIISKFEKNRKAMTIKKAMRKHSTCKAKRPDTLQGWRLAAQLRHKSPQYVKRF